MDVKIRKYKQKAKQIKLAQQSSSKSQFIKIILNHCLNNTAIESNINELEYRH